LLRVHPGDSHVPTEWDRSDAVLRLSTSPLEEQRAEADREALDPHAGELRSREVAQLVQEDEHQDADSGQQPGHVATASRPSRAVATLRASASASYRSSKLSTGRLPADSSVPPITRGMSRNASRRS